MFNWPNKQDSGAKRVVMIPEFVYQKKLKKQNRKQYAQKFKVSFKYLG